MMNKWLKSILCIGFALMFCFLSVGYASLNDSLFVTGTVSYTPPTPSGPKPGDKVGTFKFKTKDTYFSYSADVIYDSENTYTVTLTTYGDKDTYCYFSIVGKEGYYTLDKDSKTYDYGIVRYQNSASFNDDYNFVDDPGKYKITIHLDTMKYELKTLAEYKSLAAYSINTVNVQNLSISSSEAATMARAAKPNLLLTLTPDEGYLLPESFTISIGETVYTINTNGENELETMLFDTESSTLYILGDLLPTDGSAVFVTAYAVPETPPYTLQFNLENLTESHYTADGGLYIQLIPDEDYPLPETFTVTIGETVYTIDTVTAENNPAGMGFDALENKLYIAGVLLPTDGGAVTITASAVLPEEEEPEETEPEETEPEEEETEETEPEETEPEETEPEETEPEETEPEETEPEETEPEETEPEETEPEETEPEETEPEETEPEETEPPATEPPATEPPATEPPVTEPPATEPPATEPPATEPPATEPPATEPPVTEPPTQPQQDME